MKYAIITKENDTQTHIIYSGIMEKIELKLNDTSTSILDLKNKDLYHKLYYKKVNTQTNNASVRAEEWKKKLTCDELTKFLQTKKDREQ